MSDYTVYIDEAGDLGIGRGTKWFVLTAVVVKKTDEPMIRAKIGQIKSRLNIREIHIREIRDFMKRSYIVKEFSEESFTYMNVVVDTSKFDASKIPSSLIAYNFVCKYLLQRVSWFLESVNGCADIVLSTRGTARDGELISYITDKLLPYKGNDIRQDRFEKVSAKAAPQWDMLQLADVCATTLFLAYEVNQYGFTTPCFTEALKDHLYKRNNTAMSYGIKFFTEEMIPNIQELRKTRICIKKERIPGATTT